MRDSAGNPTGIFKDAARLLITSLIPVQNEQQLEKDFLATQELAAQNGVTSIQDMSSGATDPLGPLKLLALQ